MIYSDGRIEHRLYRQLLINELIPEAGKCSGIKTVIEVSRQHELKSKVENEIQCVYRAGSIKNLPSPPAEGYIPNKLENAKFIGYI